MRKPIPRGVLCHTVTHGYNPVADAWGVTTYTTRTINRVRIEPTSRVVYGTDNHEKQLTGIMFYDLTNSEPNNITFVEGDTITLNAIKRTVAVIDYLYDDNQLHHLELGLI